MKKKNRLNKKVVIPVVLILLIVGIIGGVVGVNKYYKSKELLVIISRNIDVSLGDKIYNTDAVKKIVNGKVVDKKKVINTDKVGIQKIKLTIEDYFKKTKDYSFEVEVKDTIAPVIEAEEKLTTPYDTKIDLLKDVKATDNYDKDIEVKVEGEYDLKKAGEYKLQYVAKDSSGNETKKDVVLIVKEKVVEVPKVVEKPTTNNSNNQTQNNSENQTQNNSSESASSAPVVNQDGSFTTSKGFHGETRNGITYIDGVLIANKTYALPKSYAPGGLTGETRAAADKLTAGARDAGYSIKVQSGFRSYDTQQNIYNRYVRERGKASADTFSARPGHSEHQTGLAFDVCESSGKYKNACINSNFDSTEEAKWLSENAYKYGFILRYPNGKTNETGYKYESWHFRYVGVDLATKLYNDGNWITLENYFGITSQYNY